MNTTPAFKSETIGVITRRLHPFLMLFYLPDSPRDPWWLSGEQREWFSKSITDSLHPFGAARLARMKRADFLINVAGVLTGRAPLTPCNHPATSPTAPAAIS